MFGLEENEEFNDAFWDDVRYIKDQVNKELENHKHDRDVMVNSVAPVWDGNETWLVLGGAGLFGAFPLAYAVIT
ncbi:cytochrome d ubiquinol oxidase subunit II, partial [Salmonella enterica subsp. enterica serovar Virginia]|nr:cytochrome d ubiquinol oxidase subunit II [Salmonella enterica subsp. enterica serovar Virginia]